ncbi:MAG: hypothetical protein DRI61_09070, partial [Chloroflexi bacterium]
MPLKIILAENSAEPSTWETFTDRDLCPLLAERFGSFPEFGRIYHNEVAVDNDVTPSNTAEVKALQELEGTLFVIIYPADPMTLLYIAVAVVVAIGASVLLQPDLPPPATLKNQSNKSPNNDLSGRTNKPRPKGRIPDIYGTVQSTPDLIAPVYTIWEGNQPIEHSLMCIGRGAYDIPAEEVKDDTTTVEQIDGASVEIFEPFTKPLPSSPKQLTVGEQISDVFVSTVKSTAVNGQVLRAPNSGTVQGDSNVGFITNKTEDGGTEYGIRGLDLGIDFRDFFTNGDSVQVSGSSQPDFQTLPDPFPSPKLGYFVNEGGTLLMYLDPSPIPYQILRGAVDVTDSEYAWDDGGTPRTSNFDGLYHIDQVEGYSFLNPPPFIWVKFVTPSNVNEGWYDLESMAGGKTNPFYFKIAGPSVVTPINLDGTYQIDRVTERDIYL